MDKIAANNFIVKVKNDIKIAKSMVAGNLARKISELKKAIEKDGDSAKREKSEKKINSLHADIKLLKTIDPVLICKNAMLKPDPKHWTDLMGDSRATEENRLIARVILKGRVQKQVVAFRSDHKDCDEWLEEYFEFREKKRELTEVKVATRKQKHSKNDKTPEKSNKKNDLHNKNPHKNKQWSQERRGKVVKEKKKPNGTTNVPADKVQTGSSKAQAKQESLHPSWASKRKEKEILKAALSGKAPAQPKRIILSSS